MQNHKIDYLEGLRGIACMVVIFDHCVNGYYPSLRFTDEPGLSGLFRNIIAWSPLNIVYSGLISVSIFFILSGYVLSYKYHKTKQIDFVVNAALKRYVRLQIPVFFSILFFVAVMQMQDFIFNTKHDYSIIEILKISTYNIFISGTNLLNGPLWTMKIELIGSFIVFSILFLTHKINKRWIIYLIAMLITFGDSFSLFILGLILCDAYTSGYCKRIFTIKNSYINSVLLIISLVLISYPTIRQGVVIGGLYSCITFNNGIQSYYHVIGVYLLFISILNSHNIQALFHTKVFLFLGKISFSAYIIHYPIILFIGSLRTSHQIQWHEFLYLTVLVFTTTLILSVLFEKYIDVFSVKISNMFAKFLRA